MLPFRQITRYVFFIDSIWIITNVRNTPFQLRLVTKEVKYLGTQESLYEKILRLKYLRYYVILILIELSDKAWIFDP